MTTVIDDVCLFLGVWLLTWAVLMAAYLALVTAAEYVKDRWRRYQRLRQYRRATAAELALIECEAEAAVMRMSAVFTHALRQMHERLGPG
jgi:hypothetical protein